MDRKKKAMELMGKQSGSGMPSKAPSPMEQGPVLNETGAQPEAGRFMNAIAKRKAMKGMKK